MTEIKEAVSLAGELAERRELASICEAAIEKEVGRGRLKRPGSMRNLRRWLRREVVKKEGLAAGRERLMKAAAILLIMSGLILSGGPSEVPEAQAATFTNLSGVDNPLDGVNVTYWSSPFFADIDSDGDLDAFIGDYYYGQVHYYENIGNTVSPTFTERTGTANPLNFISYVYASSPKFVDIDSDGDMDVFTGDYLYGSINYYENIGNSLTPSFEERTGVNNPFNGVSVGYASDPAFVDIDSDGDLDVFVGERYGGLMYYENIGSSVSPTFEVRTGADNPFNGVSVGHISTPVFSDVDKDGDLDAFLGEENGKVFYYENIGNSISPTFEVRTGPNNPLDGVDVGFFSNPAFADIDSDGDPDAFVGEQHGDTFYYKNDSPAHFGTFLEHTGTDNPLDGYDASHFSNPTFVDIDADGDMDLFAGNYFRTLRFYENTGLANSPAFTERTGGLNPFDSLDTWERSNPEFVDIDGDGDMDAFVGNKFGKINYYENTGSAENPLFTERTGALNPMNNRDVGDKSIPAFVDIDADGDMDAFVGEYYGKLIYFENIGNSLSPDFLERTGSLNPLNSVDVGWESAPTFVDLDLDGDMDAFIGNKLGAVKHYENIGNSVSPSFTELTGNSNQFNGVDVGMNATPAFADMDRDGDLDAIVGDSFGKFQYFEWLAGNYAPTFDGTPAISGAPKVGEVLGLTDTATTDADGDTVTLSYQWQADGEDIASANSDTYTLSSDESGKSITCTLRADDGNGGIAFANTSGVTVPEADGGSGSSGSGCFIATAAYGSYMEPDVMALREFRDNHLLTNGPGRKFVELYYKYSPPVADVIAGNEVLRTAARWALSPLVYGVKYPVPVVMTLLSGLTVLLWRTGRRAED